MTVKALIAGIISAIVGVPSSFGFLIDPMTPSSDNSVRGARTLALSSSSSSSCVAQEARSLDLFTTTPLVYSAPLSRLCHPHPVYLKLDLLQPSGSFKDRGMAHLCATVHRVHGANRKIMQRMDDTEEDVVIPRLRLISSSGGNAGLAVTTVARRIPDTDVSVVVPMTTKPLVIEKLRSLGAEVTIHGDNWNDADALARQWVDEAKERGVSAIYVSPYDNPLLWTGHSTVIDEIITQLLESPSSAHLKIGAVLASVGGGGLLCGIFEGIERNYYGKDEVRTNVVRGIKVVACETEGAASFAASFDASTSSIALGGKKELSMVRLSGITSVATSLGALEVTPAVIQRAHRHQDRGQGGGGEDVLSYVCTDSEAVDACIKFAADHRMLVEPACGAALAPLFSERLRSELLGELRRDANSAIVVEVCGGSGVNLDLLEGWKAQFLSDKA